MEEKKKRKKPVEQKPSASTVEAITTWEDISKAIQKNTDLNKTNVDKWAEQGAPCYYARFHSPVAPTKNKEPVSEFYLESYSTKPDKKYIVDCLFYTPHGLVWRQQGETDITPLANVQWVRTI